MDLIFALHDEIKADDDAGRLRTLETLKETCADLLEWGKRKGYLTGMLFSAPTLLPSPRTKDFRTSSRSRLVIARRVRTRVRFSFLLIAPPRSSLTLSTPGSQPDENSVTDYHRGGAKSVATSTFLVGHDSGASLTLVQCRRSMSMGSRAMITQPSLAASRARCFFPLSRTLR